MINIINYKNPLNSRGLNKGIDIKNYNIYK